ncbi:MAG TPA: helix-turn-helix domain-containing protein [Candidatus Coprousia avicola]|nr:helix-turn-helix domain-containing protein [Candidatus Coprousia avicola]
MAEGKRTTYNQATRLRAVEALEEGISQRALAAQLGIPAATARQWARAFAAGGRDAVLNGGSTHRSYDLDTKIACARDRVEKGRSVREVMIAYGVTSESSVKMWCRKYRADGVKGLVSKPRGRKPQA